MAVDTTALGARRVAAYCAVGQRTGAVDTAAVAGGRVVSDNAVVQSHPVTARGIVDTGALVRHVAADRAVVEGHRGDFETPPDADTAAAAGRRVVDDKAVIEGHRAAREPDAAALAVDTG